jgi:hypothetical protein
VNKEVNKKSMAKKTESVQENLIPEWKEVVPTGEGISVPNELKDLLNTSFVVSGFEVFPLKDKPGKEWVAVEIKDCSDSKFPDGKYRISSEVIIKGLRKAEDQIKKTGVHVTLVKPGGKRYYTFV